MQLYTLSSHQPGSSLHFKRKLLIFRSALWYLQLIQRLSPSHVSSFLVTSNEYAGTGLVGLVVHDAARLQNWGT